MANGKIIEWWAKMGELLRRHDGRFWRSPDGSSQRREGLRTVDSTR
jgi:hypothetical protein